jgi:hypothetical protein
LKGLTKNAGAQREAKNMGRKLEPSLSRGERMGHPPRLKARLFLFFGVWSIKDADTEILGASAPGSRAEHGANTEILDAVRVQNDDPRISGQGFHQDFDLQVVGTACDVHGSEVEGLVGGDDGITFDL